MTGPRQVEQGALFYEFSLDTHIPVFDKSGRSDGTFSRSTFTYDPEADAYTCPAGKPLRPRQRVYRTPLPLVDDDGMIRDRASKRDYGTCPLKLQCCSNTPARKIPRPAHDGARQMARDICASEEGRTSRRESKKVEMLFACGSFKPCRLASSREGHHVALRKPRQRPHLPDQLPAAARIGPGIRLPPSAGCRFTPAICCEVPLISFAVISGTVIRGG